MARKRKPEVVADTDLDQASGGISLVVPAVQSVTTADQTTTDANAALGDGSVRIVKDTIAGR